MIGEAALGRRGWAAPPAQAEVETDRFSNLITCGVICAAMTALRPRRGPRVTADQAPRRARSMRLRSSHIFNGVTRNGHATSLLHHFITIVRTNYCYLQKQKSQCSCELYLSREEYDVLAGKVCRCGMRSELGALAAHLSRLIRPRWRRILNPLAMGSRGEERDSHLVPGPSRTAAPLQRLLPAKAATISSKTCSSRAGSSAASGRRCPASVLSSPLSNPPCWYF